MVTSGTKTRDAKSSHKRWGFADRVTRPVLRITEFQHSLNRFSVHRGWTTQWQRHPLASRHQSSRWLEWRAQYEMILEAELFSEQNGSDSRRLTVSRARIRRLRREMQRSSCYKERLFRSISHLCTKASWPSRRRPVSSAPNLVTLDGVLHSRGAFLRCGLRAMSQIWALIRLGFEMSARWPLLC